MLGFTVFLGVVGLALGGVAVWVLDTANSAPSIDTLKPADSGANSEVFDAEGNSLGFVQSEVLREPVELKNVPESLQQATIAIEDENFYEHGGVDYAAIFRAAIENVEAGEVKQGASTITQQLVRNLYIEDPEDTIERKIIEAAMAQEYEDEYTKEEILEQYLNTAAYGTNDGRTAVGVKSAARVFFDKDIEKVNPNEAALLAGLPQAPTDYNPFLNPKGATQRRNLVLNAMADQGYITAAEAEKYKSVPLDEMLDRGTRYEEREQQYFFDYVQQELIDRYGMKTVRTGGLKVYTTLEPDLQAAAEQAIANNPCCDGIAARALVSTRTDTGEIIAMASSQTYDSSQFNLAAQGKRQPGSAFKPFVLTTAVDQGIDPDTTSYPGPESITLYPDGPYGAPWTVSGGGSGTLRQATANSVNVVYAQLGIDVGPENFVAMAKKMGIESPLDGYAAEALGGTTECCTVLEMSNAYATIANGGVLRPARIVRTVDGESRPVTRGRRVISRETAASVRQMLEGVLAPGGTAVEAAVPGYDLAGKTGTANKVDEATGTYSESRYIASFVGFAPADEPRLLVTVMVDEPQGAIYGGEVAAPAFQQITSFALNYLRIPPE